MSLVDTGRVAWGQAVAGLAVSAVWSCMAVRTTRCLRLITNSTIPYLKRTIWLLKILALIVGAGGVAGALIDLGTPWFVAVDPAGTIVYFSLAENVAEVVPAKPMQDAVAYRLAWREYRRLRIAYQRSSIGFAATILFIILLTFSGWRIPPFAQVALFGAGGIVLLVSVVAMSFSQWKWLHWPCPCCGCSFQGQWVKLRQPKQCVYCGLPRDRGLNLRTALFPSPNAFRALYCPSDQLLQRFSLL